MRFLLLDLAETEIRDSKDRWGVISPIPLAKVGEGAEFDDWLARDAPRHAARAVLRPGLPDSAPGSGVDRENATEIEDAFRAWSLEGAQVLAGALRRIEELATKGGPSILLWPHLGSLVSDIPGILNLARRFDSARILLEPAALLPDPRHAHDFLSRVAELLDSPAIAAVLLSNLDRRPVHDGALDPALLKPIAHGARATKLPLIFRGDHESLRPQLDVLELS